MNLFNEIQKIFYHYILDLNHIDWNHKTVTTLVIEIQNLIPSRYSFIAAFLTAFLIG